MVSAHGGTAEHTTRAHALRLATPPTSPPAAAATPTPTPTHLAVACCTCASRAARAWSQGARRSTARASRRPAGPVSAGSTVGREEHRSAGCARSQPPGGHPPTWHMAYGTCCYCAGRQHNTVRLCCGTRCSKPARNRMGGAAWCRWCGAGKARQPEALLRHGPAPHTSTTRARRMTQPPDGWTRRLPVLTSGVHPGSARLALACASSRSSSARRVR